MSSLPQSGSVLGIDIGFSPKRKSGAVCRLTWDGTNVTWEIRRFRYDPDERLDAIKRVVGSHSLLTAAFDGPLRKGLDLIRLYRNAELILTRKLGKFIGKPGQANAPVGIKLNEATNNAVKDVLSLNLLGPANHVVSISNTAIAEAFPTSFLGLMLAEPAGLAAGRAGKSDRFYSALVADGTLQRLIKHFLPGRSIQALEAVTNHDDRAGLICAITALAVAANDYSAVGDENGWIILPPWTFIAPWARELLATNNREQDGAGLYLSDKAVETPTHTLPFTPEERVAMSAAFRAMCKRVEQPFTLDEIREGLE